MESLTEGAVTDVERNDSSIRFRIGRHYFEAPNQPPLTGIVERLTVRILARESARDFAEVLVIQWRDQAPRYLGLTLPPAMHLLWASLLVLALTADNPFLLIPPLFLMGVHGILTYRKIVAISEFARQLATRRALTRNEADADVPLNVEMPAASGFLPSEVLEFTNDAIIIWELKGAGIVYWNRAAERLYGFSRTEALGRVTHHLLRTQIPGGMEAIEEKLMRYGVWVGELSHQCADENRLSVEARLALLSAQRSPRLVLEVNRLPPASRQTAARSQDAGATQHRARPEQGSKPQDP
jgi:PAS domain S-box-containing protein